VTEGVVDANRGREDDVGEDEEGEDEEEDEEEEEEDEEEEDEEEEDEEEGRTVLGADDDDKRDDENVRETNVEMWGCEECEAGWAEAGAEWESVEEDYRARPCSLDHLGDYSTKCDA
jgi:hypothetical protein